MPNMLTYETLPKVTSRWGQWYEHTIVRANGVEIGRVQRRRRYYGTRLGHRMDTITIATAGGCVLGRNVEWLQRTTAIA